MNNKGFHSFSKFLYFCRYVSFEKKILFVFSVFFICYSRNPSIPSHTLRPDRSENLICWDSCDQLGIYQLYLELISKICGDQTLARGILSCPVISFISNLFFVTLGYWIKQSGKINLLNGIHQPEDGWSELFKLKTYP